MSTSKIQALYADYADWLHRFEAVDCAVTGRYRRARFVDVSGRVLDVACGTGTTVRYLPGSVDLVGIDISPEMLANADEQLTDLGREGTLRQMDAQNLGFPDDSFETVISALSTCPFPVPVAALQEMERVFDILPALKREDSNEGQRAGPTSPLATSRLPNGVWRGDTGSVRDTSAPRGVWRFRRPFGRGIRLHRASRSSRRDGGDAPRHRFPCVRARAVPSACLPFIPRWAGTIGRGLLFACRLATASETPSREQCDSLRRPGGPQSNRQFLPVVLTHVYAVRGLNADGRDGFVGFIPAVNGRAFSSNFRKPEGTIRLVEHGRSEVGPIARYQEWRADAHYAETGCRWTQEPREVVAEAGLSIQDASTGLFGMITTFEINPQ